MIWRIRRRSTFEALRRPQKRSRSGPISVAFVSWESLSGGSATLGAPAAEFAFAVPRRLGGAVVRNKLRRRLRAAVVKRQEGLAPGAYLVSVYLGAEQCDPAELGSRLDRALEPFRGRNVGNGFDGKDWK